MSIVFKYKLTLTKQKMTQREARNGEYQYKVWEHSVWLLKTNWLLNKGNR